MLYSHCCIIYAWVLYIRPGVFSHSPPLHSPCPLLLVLYLFFLKGPAQGFFLLKGRLSCQSAYMGVLALGFWLCKAPRDNSIVKGAIQINWIDLSTAHCKIADQCSEQVLSLVNIGKNFEKIKNLYLRGEERRKNQGKEVITSVYRANVHEKQSSKIRPIGHL